MIRRLVALLLLVSVVILGSVCAWPGLADEKSEAELAAARKTLGPLQTFVGVWKGGGQVKRGSTDGAWFEEADWAWDFTGDHAAVVFKAKEGKIYASGRITPGDKPDSFILTATPPNDGPIETFTGKVDGDEGDRVLFTADKPTDGRPGEILLKLVARGRRLVMIFEKFNKVTGSNSFMAEVGYTRKGSGFGNSGEVPECVMTGGDASIPVTHEGKTYYVCCTGCRDYFMEHPDKVLAEYKQRLEDRKKAKEKEMQQ